jgi:hypothetical protein
LLLLLLLLLLGTDVKTNSTGDVATDLHPLEDLALGVDAKSTSDTCVVLDRDTGEARVVKKLIQCFHLA